MHELYRHFLDPADFYQSLTKNGFDFYTGVPDSLLKDFCAYVSDHVPASNHVITANEGSAVSVAAGYHLATKKSPVVYLQNSGFGNTVNPLLSLADPRVYSIPMLLLIGWRGEPGKKDEPQHIVQGKVMSSLMADLNIPFEVLPDFLEGATDALQTATHYLDTRKGPYAFLVKRQTFTAYKMKQPLKSPEEFAFSREEALNLIVDKTGRFDILVATTGFASRELYEIREKREQTHAKDFLSVGSMGHASAIALGIAMNKQSRQVICLDGDGAVLMHMGTIATVGNVAPHNYKHIVINNGCHDSVGGQPTGALKLNFADVAKACGYKDAKTAFSKEDVVKGIDWLMATEGPVLLELRVKRGTRKDLGRPKTTPKQNKQEFMAFLEA